ncbi:MAG: phytanoyl-CoA dioxygenase family protein [Pseudomonadales bacterium]|nr:phytanoyl-CoA dioxygenase family protein [Pseudomonadales bacterium]
MRHQTHHIEQWQQDGFVIIEDFFTPDEIAPLFDDFENLYDHLAPERAAAVTLNKKETGVLGKFHPKQFQNIESLPYAGSIDLNLISLHPALIAFAKALLGVNDVHLYQSHTWAKFTGEADYDQVHHCDFGNHTLTVPSDFAWQRSVDFVAYITDVDDDLGALHYVTKPDSDLILGTGEVRATEASQVKLKQRERSAAGPAGTLVAHSIDTFHRGTNLTRPKGRRYTMTFGYKAAGNDMIGFHVWQSSPDEPWERILNHASPEQLACLGIPKPGADYWTPRTLRLTQDRWPNWDLSAWRASIE